MMCVVRLVLGAGLTSVLAASPASHASFWQRDIWAEPERPFLFYGDKNHEESGRKEKEGDLSSITTLEELQEERKRRLSAAVMDPSPTNIESYLEINSFVLAKSHDFSLAWRDTLMASPQWDWTAAHPVVNAASTALSRERQEEISELLVRASDHWGLIFFGSADRLTEMMAPIVERFAARHRFELVRLALPGAKSSLGPLASPAGSLPEQTTARGITQFPALVLVHRTDASLASARLVATGVVDFSELARRIHRIIAREENAKALETAPFAFLP